MKKQDIVEHIALHSNLSKEEAMTAVRLTLEAIEQALFKGETVYMRGFGTWSVLPRPAKPVRNITEGTTFVMEAGHRVKFKPSLYLKQRIKETIG